MEGVKLTQTHYVGMTALAPFNKKGGGKGEGAGKFLSRYKTTLK